jgi:16S rRNA (adenine1518-N6/adenine1519-N6)-dimethyltransferase
MSSLPPLDFPEVMRAHGLYADKRLGQNFLLDDRLLEKIVRAAGVTDQDAVLEIGAGLGNLTRYLAASARRVVTVELDSRMIPAMHEVLAPFNNVQIIQGDILAQNPGDLFSGEENGYLVVANIPYYITSAVIRHLLGSKPRPRRIVLTIQREVAERICAAAGDLSLLALSVQVYGRPFLEARIPAGAFLPPPKVDSTIVRIEVYPEPKLPENELGLFFRLAKAGFGQKRKMLRNALGNGLGISGEQASSLLAGAQIDAQRRAETLSLAEWGALVGAWKAQKTD